VRLAARFNVPSGRDGGTGGTFMFTAQGPALPRPACLRLDAEAITHLAFYAGWPRAMSAMAVAKDVFGQDKDAGKA
jgi:hypothetical protein